MFEINLVPDVKAEMIKAQKKRNVVFFASAVVSAISIGIVLLLLSIKAGQDWKMSNQDSQLKQMSSKIRSYDGLEDLLTVQKQLSDLNTISSNKKMLSRVFTVLHSIVATENGDEIKISSLDVNFNTMDLTFDGQADAGPNTDGIDYRVLESFKKSIGLMKYDYGRYVDKNGNEIPTICIFESDLDGIPYKDENGNIIAYWAKGVKGCDPEAVALEEENGDSDSETGDSVVDAEQIQNVDISGDCDGEKLVCIYRTPKFKEWYKNEYMSLSGEISNVEHFESACIQYTLDEDTGKLSSSTNSCNMSPDGVEITQSTNGKDASGKLVLMFSSILHMNPEVFSFSNKHMITVAPTGMQNVTDSFIQVGDMFTEKARALEE